MVAAYVTEFQRVLNRDRLERHRPAGGDDLSMVVAYLWNTELSEALYHTLGALETSLRNSIHATLTDHHGLAEWYDTPDFLIFKQPDQVADVKQRIIDNKKPLVPGRVIAGLEFGFWTTLLSAGYGPFWNANNHALIRQAFPNAPATMQFRKKVHGRIDTIRRLRNRVFHYECIADDPKILTRHTEIVDAIGWISPQLKASVEHFDRFTAVHSGGQALIEARIRQYLGVP